MQEKNLPLAPLPGLARDITWGVNAENARDITQGQCTLCQRYNLGGQAIGTLYKNT